MKIVALILGIAGLAVGLAGPQIYGNTLMQVGVSFPWLAGRSLSLDGIAFLRLVGIGLVALAIGCLVFSCVKSSSSAGTED